MAIKNQSLLLIERGLQNRKEKAEKGCFPKSFFGVIPYQIQQLSKIKSLSLVTSHIPLLQWNIQLCNQVVLTQSSSSNPLFPQKILRLTNFMVKQRNLHTTYHLSNHSKVKIPRNNIPVFVCVMHVCECVCPFVILLLLTSRSVNPCLPWCECNLGQPKFCRLCSR